METWQTVMVCRNMANSHGLWKHGKQSQSLEMWQTVMFCGHMTNSTNNQVCGNMANTL